MSSQPLKSAALEIYMEKGQAKLLPQVLADDHLSFKNPLTDTGKMHRSWWSDEAVDELKQRVPGLDSGLYEEVWRQIESLFDEAERLVEKKRSFSDAVERTLKKRCPGLDSKEYERVFAFQAFQSQSR